MPQPKDSVQSRPFLLIEDYFVGHTKAWGIFVDRFGRLRRQFQVDIDGDFDGNQLVLTEDFSYNDGERSRRIWRIRPLGNGRYEGRAHDVAGVAKGLASGSSLRWIYDLDLAVGDRIWRVRFDDVMLRQDDAVLFNRATMSKFGVKLGEIVIFFQKALA